MTALDADTIAEVLRTHRYDEGWCDEPLELANEIIAALTKPSCPDDGACHHACAERCWRVSHAEPLSDVFPGDEWPAEVLADHADHAEPGAFAPLATEGWVALLVALLAKVEAHLENWPTLGVAGRNAARAELLALITPTLEAVEELVGENPVAAELSLAEAAAFVTAHAEAHGG